MWKIKKIILIALLATLLLTSNKYIKAQESDNNQENQENIIVNEATRDAQIQNIKIADDLPPLNINIASKAFHVKIDPGSSASKILEIRNNGKITEHIKVEVMKLEVNPETNKTRLVEKTPQDEYLNWVTLSEKTFYIKANEKKPIQATFTFPSNAAFGYYYAFVFSRTTEEIGVEDNTAAVTNRYAILGLIEAVNPNAVKELSLLEFSTDKKFYEFLPTKFIIKVNNIGNIHLIPAGNIFVDKKNETNVGVLEFNLSDGSILPNSYRIFNTSWEDGFPIFINKEENGKLILNKKGKVKQKILWNFENFKNFRIGRYTAKLLLIYDDGERDIPIEASTSFWVIPWRIILALIFISLLILRGIKSTIKDAWNKRKKNVKK